MFDKSLWKKYFGYLPTWPCPACGSVALALQKEKEKLLDEETGPSKRAHHHEAFSVDWIDRRFVTILKCQNPACGELVSLAGNVSVEEDHEWYPDEEGNVDWQTVYPDFYHPKFFYPAPPIFLIPEGVPENITEQLKKAFALIWFDCGAAANQLRAGIEFLLDDKGIPRNSRASGKRVKLSTHSRIEKFTADADAQKYLMAIKWLGNVGSHADDDPIDREDLLDGMELFEAALDRIYVRSDEKFAKIAAEINKRKGKRKKAKKKKA